MKVWITKYAFTKGIVMADAESDPGLDWRGRMITVKWRVGPTGKVYFHGRDWHTTHEAALVRVKEMIETKRKSLAKQAAKLEKFADSDWATKASTVEEAMR